MFYSSMPGYTGMIHLHDFEPGVFLSYEKIECKYDIIPFAKSIYGNVVSLKIPMNHNPKARSPVVIFFYLFFCLVKMLRIT